MAGVLQFLSLALISFLHLSFIFVVPVVIPVVAEDVWSSLPCFGQSCSYNYVLLEAWLHSMWMLVQFLWLHLSLSILLFEPNVNKDSSLFSSTGMTVLIQGQSKLFCSFWEMMSLRNTKPTSVGWWKKALRLNNLAEMYMHFKIIVVPFWLSLVLRVERKQG